MKNNHVCFFLPEVSGGGAERVVCELSTALVEKGYTVTLMLLQDRCRAYLVDPRVEILVLPTAGSAVVKIIKRIAAIRRFLKKNSGCVLISFLYRTLVYSLLSMGGLPNRWIVSERNNPQLTPNGRIHRMVRNIGFRLADRCVFQTEDAKSYFPKCIQRKGTVIPNPIPDIIPKRETGASHVILNACRLSRQKNLPLLIDAFYEIHRKYPEYRLEIYGEGPERTVLINCIDKLGLQDAVSMPGFANDIFSRYRNAEMFVSTSDYEGISNTMLEAMSIGLPVICTDCPIGGARMMIEHEKCGLLIPIGDKDALVAAMLRLIEDDIFAQALAENAKNKCKEFSIDSIVQCWEKLLAG